MNCSKWKLFCLRLWVGYHVQSFCVIWKCIYNHLKCIPLSQPSLSPQIIHVHSLACSHHCECDKQQVLSDDTVFYAFWNVFWQEHLLVQCVPLHLWIVTHFLSDLFSLRTSSACTFGLHYLFAQMASCTQRSIRGSLPCFFFVLPHLEEWSKNVRRNKFGEVCKAIQSLVWRFCRYCVS